MGQVEIPAEKMVEAHERISLFLQTNIASEKRWLLIFGIWLCVHVFAFVFFGDPIFILTFAFCAISYWRSIFSIEDCSERLRVALNIIEGAAQ